MTSRHESRIDRIELAMLRDELADVGTAVSDPERGTAVDRELLQRNLHRTVAALVAVIDEHPVDARGHCTTCPRRQPCPADVLLRCYAPGWHTSAGLAADTTSTTVADPHRWLRHIPVASEHGA